jgi:hypothetical protein
MKGCHKELKEIVSAMKGIEKKLPRAHKLCHKTIDAIYITVAISAVKYTVNNIIGILAISD